MRSRRRDLVPVNLGAEENTALYMVILVTVVSGWWAKNKVQGPHGSAGKGACLQA